MPLIPAISTRCIAHNYHNDQNHHADAHTPHQLYTVTSFTRAHTSHRLHPPTHPPLPHPHTGRTENAVKNHWNATLRRKDAPNATAEGAPQALKAYMVELGLIGSSGSKGQAAPRAPKRKRSSRDLNQGLDTASDPTWEPGTEGLLPQAEAAPGSVGMEAIAAAGGGAAAAAIGAAAGLVAEQYMASGVLQQQSAGAAAGFLGMAAEPQKVSGAREEMCTGTAGIVCDTQPSSAGFDAAGDVPAANAAAAAAAGDTMDDVLPTWPHPQPAAAGFARNSNATVYGQYPCSTQQQQQQEPVLSDANLPGHKQQQQHYQHQHVLPGQVGAPGSYDSDVSFLDMWESQQNRSSTAGGGLADRFAYSCPDLVNCLARHQLGGAHSGPADAAHLNGSSSFNGLAFTASNTPAAGAGGGVLNGTPTAAEAKRTAAGQPGVCTKTYIHTNRQGDSVWAADPEAMLGSQGSRLGRSCPEHSSMAAAAAAVCRGASGLSRGRLLQEQQQQQELGGLLTASSLLPDPEHPEGAAVGQRPPLLQQQQQQTSSAAAAAAVAASGWCDMELELGSEVACFSAVLEAQESVDLQETVAFAAAGEVNSWVVSHAAAAASAAAAQVSMRILGVESGPAMCLGW